MTTARVRRRRLLVGTGALTVVVVVFLIVMLIGLLGRGPSSRGAPRIVPYCSARGPSGTFQLPTSQAANASTIATVGMKLRVPDHGVTIALATAMQESELENVPYGTDDSVGLFQQRPSQGWGTRSELLDPNYAATAFYSALVKIPNWETIPITVAAQDVQHSASPSAYATWGTSSRVLAETMTGEAPRGFGCRLPPAGAPTPVGAMDSALGQDLGSELLTPKVGWTAACWLVAHAEQYDLRAVTYDGFTWRASSVHWKPSSTWKKAPPLNRWAPVSKTTTGEAVYALPAT